MRVHVDPRGRLTLRQTQVLRAIAEGHTEKTGARVIAEQTGQPFSVSCFRRRREQLFLIFAAKSTAHLIATAVASGMLRITLSLLVAALAVQSADQYAMRHHGRLEVARTLRNRNTVWA